VRARATTALAAPDRSLVVLAWNYSFSSSFDFSRRPKAVLVRSLRRDRNIVARPSADSHRSQFQVLGTGTVPPGDFGRRVRAGSRTTTDKHNAGAALNGGDT
jgi:hypothetical protein